MQYFIASRGRTIGVTDLGFARLGGASRSGWFHPNAAGEALMPVIASVLPAMRAYLDRDVIGEDRRSIVQPDLMGSTLFADLAEALHHNGTLGLTLHRDDGSIVPTTQIGIQDTAQLLAVAEMDDARLELEGWTQAEMPAMDDDIAADVALIRGMMDPSDDWMAEDESSAFPRYQIHVVLADADAIE